MLGFLAILSRQPTCSGLPKLSEVLIKKQGHKLIIVHLLGGLGNQMFQYAAARTLADRLGQDLLLDMRSFEHYTLHDFGLMNFKVRCRPATSKELKPYPKWKMKLFSKSPQLSNKSKWYLPKDFGFQESWKNLTGSLYLNGYFQSEKFFGKNRKNLLEDFTPQKPLAGNNIGLSTEAAQCSSVSIHVRRGDYVTNKKTLSIHGVCTKEYYQRSIKYICDKVSEPRFFVFSNDLLWAKENLDLGSDAIFVEGNDKDPIADMMLMSQCKHHIIANSSFSWWGAWLANPPSQFVVAPLPWFDSPQINSSDVVPEHWITVDKH